MLHLQSHFNKVVEGALSYRDGSELSGALSSPDSYRDGSELSGALSSVGSEHLPYKQGVVGSNPTGPT